MHETNMIDIKDIVLGPNVRGRVEEKDVQDILPSIKEEGVLQPILVTKRGDKYLLVCGERRFKASQLAGRSEIPAVVKDIPKDRFQEIQAVENLQRKDLNAIKEAEIYKELIKTFQIKDLVLRIGRSEQHINRYLKLLTLPSEILEKLNSGAISAGHGFAISQINGKVQRLEFLKEIIRDRISVRQAEANVTDRNYTEDLKYAPFNLEGCKSCEWNGEKQKALFTETVKLKGICRNKPCFVEKVKNFVSSKAEEFRKKGFKVKIVPENNYYLDHKTLRIEEWDVKTMGKNFKELCLKPCENILVTIEKDGDVKYVCSNKSCFNALTREKGEKVPNTRDDSRKFNRVNLTMRRYLMEKLSDEILHTELLTLIVALDSLVRHTDSSKALEIFQEAGIKLSKEDLDYFPVHMAVKHILQMKEGQIRDLIEKFSERFLNDYFTGQLALIGDKFKIGMKDYRADKEYLMKLTKADLLKLAKEFEISSKELPVGKKTEMIEFLLARPELKKKAPKEMLDNKIVKDNE